MLTPGRPVLNCLSAQVAGNFRGYWRDVPVSQLPFGWMASRNKYPVTGEVKTYREESQLPFG